MLGRRVERRLYAPVRPACAAFRGATVLDLLNGHSDIILSIEGDAWLIYLI